MYFIKLSVENKRIVIRGDISKLITNSRIINWLEENFDPKIHEDIIILNCMKLLESNSLFKFKNSIFWRKLKGFKIEYDYTFNEVINNELIEQENFDNFSEYAKKIWDNKYKIEDFENFCNIITKQVPNRKLYRLQALSAYHMAYSRNSCNFSVPGSGKTSIVYSVYAYFKQLNKNSVDKLLIVGPSSSYDPWIKEQYLDCFGKEPNAFRINGEISVDEKRNVLKGLNQLDYEILHITYNSIPSLINELLIFMKANNVMLVCDEAHKFKSIDGIWGGNILKLAPFAKSRIILTGTPAPNGYEDLYNIFKFIYPKKNIIGYRSDYLKKLSKSPNQDHIDDLIENIKPFFTRIKKSDLNLPSVNNHPIIYNRLNALEQKIYNRFEEVLADTDKSYNKQSIWFRMIQTCNNLHLLKKGFSENFISEKLNPFNENNSISIDEVLGPSLASKIRSIDESFIPSKHEAVKDLVCKIVNKNQKVIIWGVFIDSIKRLHKFLASQGFKGGYIVGETKKKNQNLSSKDDIFNSREEIIYSFKNLDFDYLISNPIVLGESVSLHKCCHNAIYFEQWYSVAPYVQSRDRIHRVWLDENLKQKQYETNYFHVISNKKSDTDIHHRVQSKFNRMMNIIEHEIPFFNENLENDRDMLIQNIIDEYRSRQF